MGGLVVDSCSVWAKGGGGSCFLLDSLLSSTCSVQINTSVNTCKAGITEILLYTLNLLLCSPALIKLSNSLLCYQDILLH